ncbi:NAD(P) transhydrogenase subunit alpha [Haloplanus rubicundus]|jgi:NAD(P) transhydrogenase subunit alpha|uniref:proton-translocating NAD(P)(+) transhydrogenase n=1 Tax=Haloplanus rubicundus TaxID=1547898 RepID=A0A345EGK0_9EURY|nr:NAD(P) transhydrogenase subunit alpha [Haloplanus rubicundus]AXG07907.1 NAD(P) transhydrogenase subunit alpha [Haloplanus rubicundus]AXG11322.1 NAD(P) transhydrogenase subunit alpha [Haloplanus rubicundus]
MTFVQNLTFFVLAAFVGYEIITKIPTNLHTPLMSGANAISGITLIGSVVVAGSGSTTLATGLGFVAVVMATVNVVGGYLVTNSMLEQFRSGDDRRGRD